MEYKSINPIELLSPLRFDVCAKYIYAKYRNTKSSFPLDLYSHHLKVWNNYSEYNNPNKQDLESFVSVFHDIIDSIGSDGFDVNKSYVPILDGRLINGAHRLAASILHDKEVLCKESPVTEGQVDCGYYFLKNRHCNVPGGLSSKYADAMALEYAKLKKNTFVVTLFPSAFGHESSVERILKRFSTIVYDKDITIEDYGPFNYIRMLYDGEAWLSGWNDMFKGAQIKARACFKFAQRTKVYLVESDDADGLMEAKRLIRQIYNIGKDSVHINDTHEETLRIAKSVFNDNSIHFLNKCNPKYLANFERYLPDYSDWLVANSLNSDHFCIDASAVLSSYGLRDCRDLDFLYLGDFINTGRDDFSCHNHETKYYPMHKDEVIVNPANHFYHKGLKFASPWVIKSMKQIRCEEKDLKDIQLLNSVL